MGPHKLGMTDKGSTDKRSGREGPVPAHPTPCTWEWIGVGCAIGIDHFRQGDSRLVALLDAGEVVLHPWSIGELALGNLANRDETLRLLGDLPQAPIVPAPDILRLVDEARLHGLGIGDVDVQLLASTRSIDGAELWARDRRLLAAAKRLQIAFESATA